MKPLYRVIIFALLIAIIVFKCQSDAEKLAQQKQEADAALSPEQKEKIRKQALIQSGDFQCRHVIKKLLHDPDSAEFVGNYAFSTTKKGFHYQYSIRAKNGFNATRLGLFNCFTETLSDTDLHVVNVNQQN